MRLAIPVILLAILGGCIGGSTPGTRIDGGASHVGDALLLGTVINDEIMPVESALVVVLETGHSAITDEAGVFQITDIAAGTWTLRVEEPRHLAIQESITIGPSETARVDLMLPTIPGITPHRALQIFRGHYDCAHEVPIWPGDCMMIYEIATGQQDTMTNETYAYRLPVEQHWESVVLELEWQISAENQLDGMRLYLENSNGTEDGHAYLVGAAEGPGSPLKLVVHRGELQERSDVYEGTSQKAFIPDAGELAQIRVFPRGKFYEQTSQVCSDSGCFLGVGVGLDIDFIVYATVFYVDRAPVEYSARPDA